MNPSSMRPSGAPFLGIGIAFLVLGITGRRAFLAIGVAFIVLGIVFLARRGRGGV